MTQAINQLSKRYQAHPASKTTEQVLDTIRNLELDSNPIHFSVLYEWANNLDPYFKEEVESALQADNYNDATAETLYLTLISKFLCLQIPNAEVESLLCELQTQLDKWQASSNKQQDAITQSIQAINHHSLPKAVKNTLNNQTLPLIKALISNTHKLHKTVSKSAFEINRLQKELEEAHATSMTDELTNIPNRRGFNKGLKRVTTSALQNQSSFALIILDLDFFKTINDQFGHPIGDSALRYVAKLIDGETKGKDDIARIGGEEFAVILPNTTYQEALTVANNIRLKIHSKALNVKNQSTPLQLSISGGVAMYQMNEETDLLIARADKALYAAKNGGRNRIVGEDKI